MRALLHLIASLYAEALKRRRKEDLLTLAKALAGHPAAEEFRKLANAL